METLLLMENVRIETSLRHHDDIPVLDVVGEIDIYTTPQFKEAVSAAIGENKPAIIINMAQVTYMDSSGFGTLLSATKRLKPVDGALYLTGCNEAIQRMLQITRLNTIFGVYATEDEALSAARSAHSPAAAAPPPPTGRPAPTAGAAAANARQKAIQADAERVGCSASPVTASRGFGLHVPASGGPCGKRPAPVSTSAGLPSTHACQPGYHWSAMMIAATATSPSPSAQQAARRVRAQRELVPWIRRPHPWQRPCVLIHESSVLAEKTGVAPGNGLLRDDVARPRLPRLRRADTIGEHHIAVLRRGRRPAVHCPREREILPRQQRVVALRVVQTIHGGRVGRQHGSGGRLDRLQRRLSGMTRPSPACRCKKAMSGVTG